MSTASALDSQVLLLGEKLDKRTAKIGIIGLGYVGLPLVRAFVNAGFQTLGFDVDDQKVAQLKAGQSYIEHISSQWIKDCIEHEHFEPTADMDRLGEADAIIICVPTPLTTAREPDLTYVESTGRQIARTLRPGQLVVLESTTYPGTTRDVLLPILRKSGLRPGVDFFLAFSPEREDPGNKHFSTTTIPKLVGGTDSASCDLAVSMYSKTVEKVVPVSSCEVAEAAKILENTYRCVNIAMVNELKVLFERMGIDVWEVIEAAKTKPFGFQAFYPGPGLGGHCIPIDPFYLTWVARKHEMPTRFIELAGEINWGMPHYVITRCTEALNHIGRSVRGSKIGMLGVAYKKDIDDPRESPAFKIMELLIQKGAIVSYNDPHIPVLPTMRHYDVPRLASEALTADYLTSRDLVLIVTDHSVYDWSFISRHSRLIVDSRNATNNVIGDKSHIWKA